MLNSDEKDATLDAIRRLNDAASSLAELYREVAVNPDVSRDDVLQAVGRCRDMTAMAGYDIQNVLMGIQERV